MPKPSTSLFVSYLRLLRIANGPTAIADVIMGIVVATGSLLPVDRTLLLLIASLSLYYAGMVLNDVADVKQDREQRSDRPLAAGEIPMNFAKALGRTLLLLGIGASMLVGIIYQQWLPTAIACLLAISILAYNSKLKKTKLGPWLMGLCRGLNGMLGLSLVRSWVPILLITPGIIAYVAGLTLFARDEAATSSRKQLLAGATLSVGGLLWLALGPLVNNRWLNEGPLALQDPRTWSLLWLTVILMIGRHYLLALLKPTPRRIQLAVVGAIQGIIIINAALIFGYVGVFYGLAVMALLPISKLTSLAIPAT